jgi:D-3-phosphoglycerate dehydrogenase
VSRPVVLIAEELSPATVEALGPDFDVRTCDGADRDQLLPALAEADAVLIRSATKVDAEALATRPRGSRWSPARGWASTTSTSGPPPSTA